MTKYAIFLFAACFVFLGAVLSVSAQEASGANSAVTATEVTAQDLDVKEPTLLPDSPFYFLKDWGRSVQSALTLDPVKKAELKEKFSNERLLELKKLVEKNASSSLINKAIEKYQKEIEKIKEQVDKIKEDASTSPKITKFLDKFTQQQVLQEKILEKLENQVPAEVFQKIKAARENHLEKFGQVMQKLQNETQLKERLQKYLPTDGNDTVKNFNNLEVLNRVLEKVPEKAKESIQEVIQNATEKIQTKIQNMDPEERTQVLQRLEAIVQRCQTDADCDQPKCGATGTTATNAKCAGIVIKCVSNKCVASSAARCKTYYWIDDNNKECGSKAFCGLFVYRGLRVFATKEKCLEAVSNTQ